MLFFRIIALLSVMSPVAYGAGKDSDSKLEASQSARAFGDGRLSAAEKRLLEFEEKLERERQGLAVGARPRRASLWRRKNSPELKPDAKRTERFQKKMQRKKELEQLVENDYAERARGRLAGFPSGETQPAIVNLTERLRKALAPEKIRESERRATLDQDFIAHLDWAMVQHAEMLREIESQTQQVAADSYFGVSPSTQLTQCLKKYREWEVPQGFQSYSGKELDASRGIVVHTDRILQEANRSKKKWLSSSKLAKRQSSFEEQLHHAVNSQSYLDAVEELRRIFTSTDIFIEEMQRVATDRGWLKAQQSLNRSLRSIRELVLASHESPDSFPLANPWSESRRLINYSLLSNYNHKLARYKKFGKTKFEDRDKLRDGKSAIAIPQVVVGEPVPKHLVEPLARQLFRAGDMVARLVREASTDSDFQADKLFAEQARWFDQKSPETVPYGEDPLAKVLAPKLVVDLPEPYFSQGLPEKNELVAVGGPRQSSARRFQTSLRLLSLIQEEEGPAADKEIQSNNNAPRPGNDMTKYRRLHRDFTKYSLSMRSPFSVVGHEFIPYRLVSSAIFDGSAHLPRLVPIPYFNQGHRLSACGHWLTHDDLRSLVRYQLGQEILEDGEFKPSFRCPNCRESIPTHECEAVFTELDLPYRGEFKEAFGFDLQELPGPMPMGWSEPQHVIESYRKHWQERIERLRREVSSGFPLPEFSDRSVKDGLQELAEASKAWSTSDGSFLESVHDKILEVEQELDRIDTLAQQVNAELPAYDAGLDRLNKAVQRYIDDFADSEKWLPMADDMKKELEEKLRGIVTDPQPEEFESPAQLLARLRSEVDAAASEQFEALKGAVRDNSEKSKLGITILNAVDSQPGNPVDEEIGTLVLHQNHKRGRGAFDNQTQSRDIEQSLAWHSDTKKIVLLFNEVIAYFEAWRDRFSPEINAKLDEFLRRLPDIEARSDLSKIGSYSELVPGLVKRRGAIRSALAVVRRGGELLALAEKSDAFDLAEAQSELSDQIDSGLSNLEMLLLGQAVEDEVNIGKNGAVIDKMVAGQFADSFAGLLGGGLFEVKIGPDDFSPVFMQIRENLDKLAVAGGDGEQLQALDSYFQQPFKVAGDCNDWAIWNGFEADRVGWSPDHVAWLESIDTDFIRLVDLSRHFAAKFPEHRATLLWCVANINAALIHIMQKQEDSVWGAYSGSLERWEKTKNRFLREVKVSSDCGTATDWLRLIPALPVRVEVEFDLVSGVNSFAGWSSSGLPRPTCECYFNSLLQIITWSLDAVDLSPVNHHVLENSTWKDPVPMIQQSLWYLVTALRTVPSTDFLAVDSIFRQIVKDGFNTLRNLPGSGSGQFGIERIPADPVELLLGLFREFGLDKKFEQYRYTTFNSEGEASITSGCRSVISFDPRICEGDLQSAIDERLTQVEYSWDLDKPIGAERWTLKEAPEVLILNVPPANQTFFRDSPPLVAPNVLYPPTNLEGDDVPATRPVQLALKGAILIHRKDGEVDHYTTRIHAQTSGRHFVIDLDDEKSTFWPLSEEELRQGWLREDPEKGTRIHTLFYARR